MTGASTSLADLARSMWDAVVVGAGPAGAMAAFRLARGGAGVLLLDRARFPREKPCGCCINGAAIAALREAGLADGAWRGEAVDIDSLELSAGGEARVTLKLQGGVVLSRQRFDAALVDAAVRAGAAFHDNCAAVATDTSGDQRALHVRCDGADAMLRARLVIDASGLGHAWATGDAGRAREAGHANGAMPPRIARRSYIGLSAVHPRGDHLAQLRPGTIYMACGVGGYVGMVRLEDGRLNIAAAVNPRRIGACGGPARTIVQLLGDADFDAGRALELESLHWHGTPKLTRRARRLGQTRLLVIGDAAGYVEPFTGEGIAWALASAAHVAPFAERAIEAWDDALVRDWRRDYGRAFRARHLRCRAIAAGLRRRWLLRPALGCLRRAPALARIVSKVIHPAASRDETSRVMQGAC